MPSLDPVDAAAPALSGGPAATVFTVTHGAGNGLLTIIKDTLPLALRTSRASRTLDSRGAGSPFQGSEG